MCGGAVIDAKSVRELHFMETSQASPELTPFIAAELRRSNVVSFRPNEYYVTHKGQDVTRQVLEEVEETILNLPKTKSIDDGPEPAAQSSRKIFVVHGHDIAALTETEVLLLRWGFEPIILRDQPNSGLTVIEKIEANSDVDYALVLLTPDDTCGTDLKRRPRQNVVFEWGYLMAKLGRGRVMCLRKGDTEMPSDLHGIVRIDFEGDVREKAEDIRREFVAQGLNIAERK